MKKGNIFESARFWSFKKSSWVKPALIGSAVGSSLLFMGGGLTGILTGLKIVFATPTPVLILTLGSVFLGLGVLLTGILIGRKFFWKSKNDKAKAADKNQHSSDVLNSSEKRKKHGSGAKAGITSQEVLSTLTDNDRVQTATSSTLLLSKSTQDDLKARWRKDKEEFRQFVSLQQTRLREHLGNKPSIRQPQEEWCRELQTLCNSIHEEMKKRYLVLCRKYHSDKNLEQINQAEEVFKELQKLYSDFWKKHVRYAADGQIIIEESFHTTVMDAFMDGFDNAQWTDEFDETFNNIQEKLREIRKKLDEIKRKQEELIRKQDAMIEKLKKLGHAIKQDALSPEEKDILQQAVAEEIKRELNKPINRIALSFSACIRFFSQLLHPVEKVQSAQLPNETSIMSSTGVHATGTLSKENKISESPEDFPVDADENETNGITNVGISV